jgi:hypothetical protein
VRRYLTLLGAGTVVYRRAFLAEVLPAADLPVLRAAGLVRAAPAAATWPCDRGGACHRQVCPSPRGSATPLYAACDDGGAEDACPSIDLAHDDVAQESVAVADLVKTLRALYRLEGSARAPSAIGPEPFALGEELVGEIRRDVFLVLDAAKPVLPHFLAVRERAARPTLVLVSTAHRLAPETATRYAPGAHVEVELLEDALAVRGDKVVRAGNLRLVAPKPLELAEPVTAVRKRKGMTAPTGRIAEEIGATSWSAIKITVVDGHTVRIQNGKATIRRSYIDLGLASHGNRNPTDKWKLLLLLCAGHGKFRWKDLGTFATARNAVYVLRKALKESFGLEDDPFHKFRAVDGWRAKFFASSEIVEED